MVSYKLGQFKRKKMKEIPDFDRPRTKIIKRGVRSLSTLELMAVIIGSGNHKLEVYSIAKDLAKLVEKDFNSLDVKKLQEIPGIGKAKACQLIAALETAKRFLINETIKISNQKDVLNLIKELRDKKQEYFLTISLDGAHNLIQKRTVFIGTLNESLVHPREVFADIITDRAAAVIFVHNHTSNDVTPSAADIQVTQRLVKVGELVGVDVLDHIIVTKQRSFSFKSNGLL